MSHHLFQVCLEVLRLSRERSERSGASEVSITPPQHLCVAHSGISCDKKQPLVAACVSEENVIKW